MSLPNKATGASYGMPGGGFSNAWPVVNPATDWDAGLASELIEDVAGMTRTATRCWVVFTTASSTGSMVLNSYDATWGGNVSNVAPTPTREGTGLFQYAFPSQVTDEIGTILTPNFQRVGACVQLATFVSPTLYIVEPVLVGPSTIGVIVWGVADSAGVGFVTDGPVTIHLWGA